MTITAAIYARKSTDQAGVAEDDRSCARQIAQARAYAASKGWTVAEDWVLADDGVSGAEFASRPGFVRLMAALTPRPPFQVLVVSEISRLGREQVETAWALKRLMQAGVRVFAYLDDRELAFDSPTDKLLLSVLAFADEVERERARQRTQDAMLRKARAGKVTGGTVYGYRNEVVYGERDASGQRRRLHTERVIDPVEADVVRRIFRLSVEGWGVRRIAMQLNAEGVPAPRPRRSGRLPSWSPSSIHAILRRELYRGVILYNRVRKRDAWGQKRYLPRPEGEWVRVEAPHLRIVSDEDWQRVQGRLTAARAAYLRATGGRLYGRPPSMLASRYLLSGFAACALCGGSMIVVTRDWKRTRRPFYGCSYAWHRGRAVCDNTLLAPMDATDRTVGAAIAAALGRQEVIEAAIEATLAALDHPNTGRGGEREQLAAKLRHLDAECERLVAAIAAGGDLPSLVHALEERERQRAACRRRLQQLLSEERRPAAEALAPVIQARLRDLAGLLGRQTASARAILREVLDGTRILFTPYVEGARRWYRFAGTLSLGAVLAGEVAWQGRKPLPLALVTPAGFEPAISTLKGSRPGPD